ncbi:MAG TPA: glycosyltransferase family 2 protein [Thermoplasmata archaeon]|nr:glycosyltransferase family 2 protein [Thermoplasmata archaeon]
MGRALVHTFLFSVVLAGITVVLATAVFAWRLSELVFLAIDPPLIPFLGTGLSVLLAMDATYFFLVLPALVGILLVLAKIGQRKHPAPPPPAPFEWVGRPAAVVLTAYDDELAIGEAVKEFRSLPQVSEIIVVDNNSSDRTAEVARKNGATVYAETRQGYGFACMGGLQYALEHTQEEIIVLAEGDMTFFAQDLEKMLPYLAECDMVLGTRTTRTLTLEGSQMDWFMAWGNVFLAFLIRLRYWDNTFLGRTRLTDVGCTFRVIRREALARILDGLTVGGHYFSPHMILVALRRNLTVIEVPIRFRKRMGLSKGAGGSRARAARIGLEMVREIGLH